MKGFYHDELSISVPIRYTGNVVKGFTAKTLLD